ncbi:MAG: hypothetical protein A2286_10535 [Gammaproteobacteria bacterium RIFOXYA12_FULL_61_12]|nr:MAG: hypothetical protein A2514_10165 [Gammaproteobacteria bacterium RIFOXYD12_FULL_61_37]OGT89765.1 MAG: hypothetical protein A2286_10535 [Gammaproteobacteria bacterium RIFOXYA12_FULL_61_12]
MITNHARSRFRERWSAAFPGKPSPNNIDNEITGRFNRSRRVTDLGEKGKKRLNRYGADTLFFRADGFTFVVQDRSIVTIEISDKDMRHLNRSPLRLAS